MALFNHATKEVTAKLVYYGPGLCGKTTNLQWIHDNLTFKTKGKLVSLATQTDRTLFFDFLPVELGTIRGMRTRMQIYTVPGQVFYEATRRMVLKGCDAVVFVADSQAAMLDANAESQRSLRQNLLVNEIDAQIPQVIQYNKRDLPTALPLSVLNERLNPRNLPAFEAIAFKGHGVEDTLKGITKLLFQWLSKYYGEGVGDAASASAGSGAPPSAPRPDQSGRVMIRVPHATLGAPEASNAKPAAPAAPARPAASSRPTAPAEPEPDDEIAPTIRFAKQQPAPARPAAPAPAPPAAAPAPVRPVAVVPPAAAAPPSSPPVRVTLPPAAATPPPAAATPPPAVVAPPPAVVVPPPAAIAPPRPVAQVPPAPLATPPAPAPPAVAPPAPAPPRPVSPVVASPAVVARPAAPAPPEEEEVASTIVFAKQPPKPAPAAPPPAPAEVPLFIEEDEDEPASTIVFAKTPQPLPPAPAPSRPSATIPPLAPAPVAAPPSAPAPTVVVKPQPVVVPGTAAKPAAPANLPPGMTAPAPKPEPKKPAETKPAAPLDPPPKGEGLRQDQWLYLLEGTQRGPIDVEDLIDLVLTSIPENTKVWHPGLEGWVLANQVRQIAEEIPPPIPIPGLSRATYGDEEMPDFNTVPPMLRSVLIADEDAAFRKYLAMPLAAQGFAIYEAADGSAAWQLAVQNRPWMILADISMPELDGFEFCRRVRSHPMLSRLPLLFISGSDKYKERYRALQIGADDFLSKTMPVRELLMRIQLLMTRYSDLSATESKAGAEEVAGAFQGRIEVFGAPALLQMCAQGRLSGLFTSLAEDAQKTATVIGFREGDVISATVGDVSGADAVYAFLAWTKGSFKFTPGDPGEGEPLAQSVEHLLLEGCRLLDESQKGGPEDGAAFA